MAREKQAAPSPYDETAPVYDERGNVRPHGTPGARPMTYDERVRIAESLDSNG